MESTGFADAPSFPARVGMAFRLVFNAEFARRIETGLKLLQSKEVQPTVIQAQPISAPPPARVVAPERVHASGLFVLSALQREGRLIDFLQQDVTGFSDEEVGAAARVVHAGCSKALKQYFDFQPATNLAEGARMTVPAGFDAQRIRLTGNVTGQPPFNGTLKHHGWVANDLRLPTLSDGLDPKVLAPAEVELS